MKIHQLSVGQTVYDLHKHRMGNTQMRTWGVWPVFIKEIDRDGKWVLASWNGNPPTKYYGPNFKWKAKQPVMIKSKSLSTIQRPATREEIKAMKERGELQ